MRLIGRQVVLRPCVPDDVPRLTAIVNEPEIAAWWGAMDAVGVADEFVHKGSGFVVMHSEEIIGAIEYGEDDRPMHRHAGIDIFLTTARQGQGLGADAIRTLARYLFEERGHHRLTIDPAADNERAIRAYRAVGFRTVGVMREYERGADGSWHDGLLMDLLVGDMRVEGDR